MQKIHLFTAFVIWFIICITASIVIPPSMGDMRSDLNKFAAVVLAAWWLWGYVVDNVKE